MRLAKASGPGDDGLAGPPAGVPMQAPPEGVAPSDREEVQDEALILLGFASQPSKTPAPTAANDFHRPVRAAALGTSQLTGAPCAQMSTTAPSASLAGAMYHVT